MSNIKPTPKIDRPRGVAALILRTYRGTYNGMRGCCNHFLTEEQDCYRDPDASYTYLLLATHTSLGYMARLAHFGHASLLYFMR